MRENSGRSAVQGAWLLVLAALVLPFAARAANEGEIHNYIRSINRLYESLDYELALNQLQLARKLPRGTDEEVTLSLYEGIILCEMGKQKPGASSFRAALLLRPDAKLPVQVAPKVEALFESVRKQVKQEVDSLRPPSGTEKLSVQTEQNRKTPPAPPATGPAPETREEVKVAQPPKKESPSSVVESKAAPITHAPSAPKVVQAKEEPAALVAEQPVNPPDCKPEPIPSGQNPKERKLSRLIHMKHTLCLSGKFQGLASKKWMDLKTQMEDATTSHEWMLITQGIDQFANEFIYEDPRWEAERREAKRLEAERRNAEVELTEAERLAAKQREAERVLIKKKLSEAANLDTSKCQPAGSVDCERELLMQRLRTVQKVFLSTNPPSTLPPLRELVAIGNEIRAARTSEQLGEAAHAINSWEQRHFP
ncbi:hypothetical protein ACN28I_26470 [Archangium gephyra]|uniref:hypothetical protein n=1 Tax=Archangium gephyra TaxID=48 RepID=UPI003B81E703